MKRGPPVLRAGSRGAALFEKSDFRRFGTQEWSGWVRTADSVHLVFVSGQTVDYQYSGARKSGVSRKVRCTMEIVVNYCIDPFRAKFDVFGPDRNFGQPGLDLTGTLDTRSEAALDVTIRNQTQN